MTNNNNNNLQETLQKAKSSLVTAIEEHVSAFSPNQGLDYLATKNSLLLSYLIDLVLYIRANNNNNNNALRRLLEMKTILDKTRNLDKRLRYQVDKLLSYQSTASSFAASGEETNHQEDPLQFRPGALDDDDDNNNNNDKLSVQKGDSESSSSSDDDNVPSDHKDDNDHDHDEDEWMQQTRQVLKATHEEKEEAALYQAPRTTAVPYTHDKVDRQAAREQRQRRRMRASELAHSLRHEYGDAPEHELGTTNNNSHQARVAQERHDARIQFEETQMVRLTVTRQEKKERQRLLRQEQGNNLQAIANLGNLARDVAMLGEEDNYDEDRQERLAVSGRHANGKRKRQIVDADGRVLEGRSKKHTSKNALQASLFESRGSKTKKKKKH